MAVAIFQEKGGNDTETISNNTRWRVEFREVVCLGSSRRNKKSRGRIEDEERGS